MLRVPVCRLLLTLLFVALVPVAALAPSAPPFVQPVAAAPMQASTPPTIARLTPASVPAGYPDFTLVIDGSGFASGAIARINGFGQPTTVVSSSQLLVPIEADTARYTRTFSITVSTPDGATSPSPAFFTVTAAQPAPPFVYTGSLGGGAITAPVSGTIAYLAEGSQLTVLDVSTPSAPRRLSSYPTTDVIMDAEIAGSLLYLAVELGGVLIFDLRDATQPQLLGSFNTDGEALQIKVVGTRAYVSEGFGGLDILDVSDPTRPRLLGEYGGSAFALDVVSNQAIVSTIGSGVISVLDVSDPTRPRSSHDTYPSDFSSPYDLKIVGNRLLVASGSKGFVVSDYVLPSSTYYSFELPGGGRGLTVVGNRAYVTSGEGDLFVFDISNINKPVLLGSYDTPGRSPDVQVVGERAFVADISSLQILDIANPAAIRLLGAYATWDAQDVAVAGDYAYIAAGPSGLQIVDRRVPTRPVARGGVPPISRADAVAVADGLAYVANRVIRGPEDIVLSAGGVQIVDVRAPDAPVVRGTIPITDARRVQVSGKYAYVAANDGFYVIDGTANPPRIVSRVAPESSAPFYDVDIVGTRAYVLENTYTVAERLVVFDISNPAQPRALGSYPVDSARRVQANATHAYVIDDNDEVVALSVQQPSAISVVGRMRFPDDYYSYPVERLNDIELVDGYLVLAGSSLNQSALFLLDIVGPKLLVVIGETKLSGFAEGLAAEGDRIFVATADGGLQIRQLRRDLLPVSAALPTKGGRLVNRDANVALALEAGTLSETLVVSYTGLTTPSQPLPNALLLRSFVPQSRTP
jgi:hypothetical protein